MVPLSTQAGAVAVIRTVANPAPDEAQAAQELGTYLKKITGQPFKVVTGDAAPDYATVIEIGQSGAASVKNELAKVADAPDGYVISAAPGHIYLAGTTPEGTLFAAYDFLEKLGCRWYIPGELGEVVPRQAVLSYPVEQRIEKPSFASRHLQAHDTKDPWYRRQRLGGLFFYGSHGSDAMLPASVYFKEHPEYYALVDGVRKPAQLCYTSAEGTQVAAQNVIKQLKALPPGAPKVAGIGPNDGGGFCRCENCMKLYTEWDPYSNEWSISDAFIAWANKVSEIARQEVPEAHFGFYIYHSYNLPPRKVKPHASIAGALAPITFCRVHSLLNPICDESHAYRRIMDGWGAIMPELYQRGYGFQLASPQFLWSRVHVWRDEVPYAYEHGVKGWRVETPPSWANDPVTHWVFSKLMWNAHADVDALVDDFHRNFYGPAYTPAKSFWTSIDARFRDSDYHTGNAWDEPHFFPPDFMRKLEGYLKQAEKAAPKDSIYAKRVQLMRLAWEREGTFLQMRANHDTGKFAEAKAALDKYDALTKTLASYNPPMVQPFMATRYMDIFWRNSITSAYERSTNGKRVLAVLPDAWKFHIDPANVGMMQDWNDTTINDNNWSTLRTLTGTWSDQGLRLYKGTAWYRTIVTLPAQHDGKVMLWFGAVDEDATVWVNGKEVGKKPDKNESNPFEFDVTSAIKPGQPNLVAVRIENKVLDELGTGGLMKVAMFYTSK